MLTCNLYHKSSLWFIPCHKRRLENKLHRPPLLVPIIVSRLHFEFWRGGNWDDLLNHNESKLCACFSGKTKGTTPTTRTVCRTEVKKNVTGRRCILGDIVEGENNKRVTRKRVQRTVTSSTDDLFNSVPRHGVEEKA